MGDKDGKLVGRGVAGGSPEKEVVVGYPVGPSVCGSASVGGSIIWTAGLSVGIVVVFGNSVSGVLSVTSSDGPTVGILGSGDMLGCPVGGSVLVQQERKTPGTKKNF